MMTQLSFSQVINLLPLNELQTIKLKQLNKVSHTISAYCQLNLSYHNIDVVCMLFLYFVFLNHQKKDILKCSSEPMHNYL